MSIQSRSFLASAGERTGVDPFVTTCFGAPHGRRGIHREDLADDEPVAEHADRGQVLLDGRDRSMVGPDVGGHVERGHRLEAEASRLAPPQELPHLPPVRRPGSCVRNPPREELQKPRDGIRPRVDDHLRQRDPPRAPMSVTARCFRSWRRSFVRGSVLW